MRTHLCHRATSSVLPVGHKGEIGAEEFLWHLSLPSSTPGASRDIQLVCLSAQQNYIQNMSQQKYPECIRQHFPCTPKMRGGDMKYSPLNALSSLSHLHCSYEAPCSPLHLPFTFFLCLPSSGFSGHSIAHFPVPLSPSFINIYTANLFTWQLEG